MANTIGMNYDLLFRNSKQIGKRTTDSKKDNLSNEARNLKYENNFTLELSESGLAALANQKKNSVDNTGSNNGALQTDEQKLSSKAQDYLDKLRDKYGD